jgi:hypothetical protein
MTIRMSTVANHIVDLITSRFISLGLTVALRTCTSYIKPFVLNTCTLMRYFRTVVYSITSRIVAGKKIGKQLSRAAS